MKCEEKWCLFYNVQYNSNFYNCTNKGRGSKKGRKTTQEFKNRLSIIMKGNKHCNGKNKIPINQYDLQGNFIKEWGGAIDIFNELKIRVTKCCKKKGKTAGCFIWRYKNEPLDLTKENLSEILTKKDKGISKPITNIHKKNIGLSLKGRKCTWDTSTMREKIVLQYDLQGNFIKEWKNAQEACNKLKLNSKSNILFCCRNKSKQAYGYKWKYKKNVGN